MILWLSQASLHKISGSNLGEWKKGEMPLGNFCYENVVIRVVAFELEKHNPFKNLSTLFVFHHLRSNRAGSHFRVLSMTIFQVLEKLGNPQSISFAFYLNGNNKMYALAVCPDIKLIDFNLADSFNFRAKMILK